MASASHRSQNPFLFSWGNENVKCRFEIAMAQQYLGIFWDKTSSVCCQCNLLSVWWNLFFLYNSGDKEDGGVCLLSPQISWKIILSTVFDQSRKAPLCSQLDCNAPGLVSLWVPPLSGAESLSSPEVCCVWKCFPPGRLVPAPFPSHRRGGELSQDKEMDV